MPEHLSADHRLDRTMSSRYGTSGEHYRSRREDDEEEEGSNTNWENVLFSDLIVCYLF